ncbi:histidine phosphatase family protein [Kiloniella litopenaei]|uniref:histidine phosphatase family protein n=1 Tax=Kiloniella litopenaei TaxID=1549748 RepID=UPI0009E5D427|nr:histidine phosphatase family protein [Kiloniella litopenaei]
MAELLIFRHGPTIWNAEKRIQGRSDISLSEQGIETVQKWQLPDEWMAVPWYVSPLQRAQETAKLLGQEKLETDPLLIEMSWGKWEGQRLPELRKKLGPEMEKMEALGLDLCPPGGESPRDVQNRLKPFLYKVAGSNQSAVAVAHKGVLRALYAEATNWDMLGKPKEKIRDNCAHLFQISSTGIISVKAMNISLLSSIDFFPRPIKQSEHPPSDFPKENRS